MTHTVSGLPAAANPTSPTVISGTAAFRHSGNLLQISNSPGAIIHWGGFSIGANEITRFVQQSQSSAVLNRVTGRDPSAILGTLQSNGRVFLINPSGIVFGKGAQVDVAGLVASTLDMSNADFLAGRMRFREAAGAGSVVNTGALTAATGGQVYLLGPAVTNQGIITTPKGEVILAAGNSVELVNPGTPNLRVEVRAGENEAKNLGKIVADSGRIGIYAGLINQTGTIRADTVQMGTKGEILLRASKNITLAPDSLISASGAPAGIHDGGTVRVVAEGTLDVPRGSSIRATGGRDGGDGGFIELSGKERLNFGGSVGLEAPRGRAGMLLLDPRNIIIGIGSNSPLELFDQFGENAADDPIFHPTVITAVTNTGASVILQANNDITINQPILTNNPSGDGGAVTLRAGRSVLINAEVSTDNGVFTVVANDTLASGVINALRQPGSAAVMTSPSAPINTGSGNISLTVSTGEGLTNKNAGDVSLFGNLLTTTGSVSVIGPGEIFVSSPIVTAGGAANLQSTDGGIQITQAITTSGGNVTLQSRGPIAFSGPDARVDAGIGTAAFISTDRGVSTGWLLTQPIVPQIHVTASSATFTTRDSVQDIRTRINVLNTSNGDLHVHNEGDLVFNLMTTGAGFFNILTTGTLRLGRPVNIVAVMVGLSGGKGLTLDQEVVAGGLGLDGGKGDLNIRGVNIIASNLDMYGANIHIGDPNASMPTFLGATFVRALPAGHFTVQGGTASGASAIVSAASGALIQGGGDVRVRGGSGADANAVVSGANLHLTVGGAVRIDPGPGTGAHARISSPTSGTMRLEFPKTPPAGYFINGEEGALTSGASGFLAAGLPAMVPRDLLISYGSSSEPNCPTFASNPFAPSKDEVTLEALVRNASVAPVVPVVQRASDTLTTALTTEMARILDIPDFLPPDLPLARRPGEEQ